MGKRHFGLQRLTLLMNSSHLVNDGVEESPPSKPSANGSGAAAGPDSSDVFVNLEQANVGFKHWHPMPVTPYGNKLAGQGEMGGLWEWTSSALVQQEGFKPMKLYPAYSGMSPNQAVSTVATYDVADLTQPTSTTESIILSSAARGRRIRESLDGRPCTLICLSPYGLE